MEFLSNFIFIKMSFFLRNFVKVIINTLVEVIIVIIIKVDLIKAEIANIITNLVIIEFNFIFIFLT